MPSKPLNLKKIAAKNQRVNLAKAEESIQQIKALRQQGIHAAEYGLLSPLARRIGSLGTIHKTRP